MDVEMNEGRLRHSRAIVEAASAVSRTGESADPGVDVPTGFAHSLRMRSMRITQAGERAPNRQVRARLPRRLFATLTASLGLDVTDKGAVAPGSPEGRVALVAGATRGAGRAIAV